MTREEAITWLENRAKQIPLPGALEVYRMAIAALRELDAKEKPKTPCDLCLYNPPSSGDGKPCTMCPASSLPEPPKEDI